MVDLIPKTVLEKTLTMQLAHVLGVWEGCIARYKLDSKHLGPRTQKYLMSHAREMESLLERLKEDLKKIRYEEVD